MVTLGNEEVLIVGGHDKTTNISSTTHRNSKKRLEWKIVLETLTNAKSNEVFGKKDADEWSYPKAFLASDGSVVEFHIKIWKLDYEGEGTIKLTGKIPLEKNGIKQISTSINPNDNSKQKIILEPLEQELARQQRR